MFDSNFPDHSQYLIRDGKSQIVGHVKGPHALFAAEMWVALKDNLPQTNIDPEQTVYWVVNHETERHRIMTRDQLIELYGDEQFNEIVRGNHEVVEVRLIE